MSSGTAVYSGWIRACSWNDLLVTSPPSERRTCTAWWCPCRQASNSGVLPSTSSSLVSWLLAWISASMQLTLPFLYTHARTHPPHQARWNISDMGLFGVVRSHSRSSATSSFDRPRAHTTSYLVIIKIMRLSCAVVDMWYAELTSKSDTDFGDHSAYTRLSFVR